MRAAAAFASGQPDETSKDAIREAQEQARAGCGVMVPGATSSTAVLGRVSKDGEGLFRCAITHQLLGRIVGFLFYRSRVQNRPRPKAHTWPERRIASPLSDEIVRGDYVLT